MFEVGHGYVHLAADDARGHIQYRVGIYFFCEALAVVDKNWDGELNFEEPRTQILAHWMRSYWAICI